MSYEYQPYPKWIDTPSGRRIVRSEEEHHAHLSQPQDMPGDADRNDLIAQAEAAGIATDGRWSTETLKARIAEAQSQQAHPAAGEAEPDAEEGGNEAGDVGSAQ